MDENSQKTNVLIGMFFSMTVLLAVLLFSVLFRKLTTDNELVFWLGRLSIWVCLLFIYLFVSQIEKQKFLLWTEMPLNFTEYFKSFFRIIFAIIVGAIIIGLTLKFLGNDPKQGSKFVEIIQILKNSFPLLIFTCLTAGITEELIFRGYLMPRLQLFFNNNYASIIISSILFGLMHIGYGTIMQIIGPVFIGFVFAVHYQKYRNIKILIFCHFFWDFMSIMANAYLKP